MVTQIVLEWWQGAKLLTCKRTNFIAAPEAKNDGQFCFGLRRTTAFTWDPVATAFKKDSRCTFCDQMRNEKTLPMVCLLWWEHLLFWNIAFWVRRTRFNTQEAVEPVDRGSNCTRRPFQHVLPHQCSADPEKRLFDKSIYHSLLQARHAVSAYRYLGLVSAVPTLEQTLGQSKLCTPCLGG